MNNLRAYFFTNMYLTGIHAGIQAQHCTAEMFMKYDYLPSIGAMLYDWASNHKTTIILNGGYASNLYDLTVFLEDDENPYPWGYFKESEIALGGCITSVGIVLPEKIWETSKLSKESGLAIWCFQDCNDLSDFDVKIAEKISQSRLMN